MKLMINKKTNKKISYFVCFSMLFFMLCKLPANAENLPCQSAAATGYYAHPITGVIEDSGGESNQALGQSMVSNVVDSNALIEDASDHVLISVRFHLMNSLSDVKLSIQTPGSTSWESVSYEKTAVGNDTADLRFSAPDANVYVRAECKVDAMGRYVIFFIGFSNLTEGNAGGFVQTEDVNQSQDSLESSVVSNLSIDTAKEIEESAETITAPASTTQETVSDSSVQSLLQDVEGMTIGGSSSFVSTDSESADSAFSDADPNAQADTVSLPAQPLNISSSVWFRLFIVFFSANLLSGLTLFTIKDLISYLKKRTPKTGLSTQDDPASSKDTLEPDSYLDLIDALGDDFYEESSSQNEAIHEAITEAAKETTKETAKKSVNETQSDTTK